MRPSALLAALLVLTSTAARAMESLEPRRDDWSVGFGVGGAPFNAGSALLGGLSGLGVDLASVNALPYATFGLERRIGEDTWLLADVQGSHDEQDGYSLSARGPARIVRSSAALGLSVRHVLASNDRVDFGLLGGGTFGWARLTTKATPADPLTVDPSGDSDALQWSLTLGAALDFRLTDALALRFLAGGLRVGGSRTRVFLPNGVPETFGFSAGLSGTASAQLRAFF